MITKIYQPKFYQDLDETKIIKDVVKEGFDPIKLSDPPGSIYHPHTHPETKLLAFLKGSMEVKAGGKEYHCQPGDKLIIPGKVKHSAVVGKQGCTFFWSERLM